MNELTTDVALEIGGMTCASCAARVEKQLNRIDGVDATVNFATEEARVRCADPVTVETSSPRSRRPATRPARSHDDGHARHDEHDHDDPRVARRLARLRGARRAGRAPRMVPALQFDGWEWVSLALATPVVMWGAWPFHRTAWAGARHGTATMDTLISIGVLAAYGWSLSAVLATDDRHVRSRGRRAA